MKAGFVYIMTSRLNGTIYTGVTSNLVQRAWQHRNGLLDGFTRKYGCKMLVWFEVHEDLQTARARELQIKKWKRDWKLQLIEPTNPDWLDLFPSLLEKEAEVPGPLRAQGNGQASPASICSRSLSLPAGTTGWRSRGRLAARSLRMVVAACPPSPIAWLIWSRP